MKAYLIKRLLMVIPTALGSTIVVFLAMRPIPGDPIELLLADDDSEAARRALMRDYSLDQPMHSQYVKWIWQMLRDNWGASILTDGLVLPDVLCKLPVSLELMIVSMLTSRPNSAAPPSWGDDLKSRAPLIQMNPWLAIFPGAAILLTVLGFNLFGDGWRDALDPRLKP